MASARSPRERTTEYCAYNRTAVIKSLKNKMVSTMGMNASCRGSSRVPTGSLASSAANNSAETANASLSWRRVGGSADSRTGRSSDTD